MQWRIAFCLLIASLMVTPAAAEEDPRAPVKLPPDDNGQNSSFVLARSLHGGDAITWIRSTA